MYKLTRQQSNLKLPLTENLGKTFDSTTKQARTGSAWEQNQVCSTCGLCWKYSCILLQFLLYGTKTRIVIEVTPSLQA